MNTRYGTNNKKNSAEITLDIIAWFSKLIFLYNSNDILNINISF